MRATFMTTARCIALGVLAGSFAQAALADPLPKIEHSFADGSVLRFYGQVNKGFLTYDDGAVSQTYDLIDNYNSNTRLGLTYSVRPGGGWDYLGTVELQYDPFSTNTASLNQQNPPSSAYGLTNANVRQIDNRFANPGMGTFYLGQGDMASQDTAEVDLSGTDVIARSAVENIAGGQLLREADGTLSKVTINDAFSNYDGLGRAVRVRYDSPAIRGLGLRVSAGRNLFYTNDNAAKAEAVQDQNLADIALAYTGAPGPFSIEAQVAYSYKSSYSVAGDMTPAETILDGSASVLHVPTGLSLTAALGQQDSAGATGNYGYVKAGWQADLFRFGRTAFAVDYYSGLEINGTDTESRSTGVSVVQTVANYNTELWASYRRYSYASPTARYDDPDAFYIGARFSF
jgi:hypothetical protein